MRDIPCGRCHFSYNCIIPFQFISYGKRLSISDFISASLVMLLSFRQLPEFLVETTNVIFLFLHFVAISCSCELFFHNFLSLTSGFLIALCWISIDEATHKTLTYACLQIYLAVLAILLIIVRHSILFFLWQPYCRL